MLNNYSLYNIDKIDELTSIFIEKKSFKKNDLEKFIAELIDYYHLQILCYNICFEGNVDCFGLYNSKQKQILINCRRIVECLEKVSVDNYFINANICRIVLHEIKHILQHDMILKKDNCLFQLFEYEFFSNKEQIMKPSEVNADIESSMVIIRNYDKNHYLYNKQLLFTTNIISSFHSPQCVVKEFCKENNLFLKETDLLNRFLYGIDLNFVEYVRAKNLK